MKCVNLVIGAIAFAVAGVSAANDEWYMGVTAGHYTMDS